MERNGICAGVDVGGTFTDVVVVADGARPRAVKVPTTPTDQSEGVAAGLAVGHPAGPVPRVGHGTTTATNAVLERNVAGTVLVTTDGFSDVLTIARQDRPSLYDLEVVRPPHLASAVVTVRERMGPDGEPIQPLTADEVRRVVAAVRDAQPASIAISLLFGYAGDAHERRLAAALDLNVPVTVASRLLPEFREYERASTCVLNAAVAPVMGRYLAGLAQRLPHSHISVMTSGGGTISLDAAAEAPVRTLLSGPAAGVVAAAAVAAAAGFSDAVAFDMGGTSTDVCLIRDGQPAVATDAEIAGLPFRVPAVDVHTAGAGGGSIAWMDPGGALRVGPRSAGAQPGPACYGQGGIEPTVTDAHAALGHLGPERALGGGLRLDVKAAVAALDRLPPEADGAQGVLTVVRATMTRALRRVTTERGIDPSGLALVAYGGAGPLHATALARELGCAAVLIPPGPGVLSALGLLLAPARVERSRTVMAAPGPRLTQVWEALDAAARAELKGQGAGDAARTTWIADARYAGQSHELRVPVEDPDEVATAFHRAHEVAYGYAMRDEPVEVVTVRVVAEGEPVLPALPADWDQGPARPRRRRQLGLPRGTAEAEVLDRASLRPGDQVDGPALIEQPDTTTLLLPGDQAEVDAAGNLVVRVTP